MSLFLNITTILNKDKEQLKLALKGGALPCIRLGFATSGYCVTNKPHLSPQHYELNAKQHVHIRQEYQLGGGIQRQ